MSEPGQGSREPGAPEPGAGLAAALRRVHRSILFLLAVCAAVIFTQQAADPEPPPDRAYTTTAVVLAAVAVVSGLFATSPVAGLRLRVGLILLRYLAAAGVGVVGVLMAADQGALRTALAFAAGGLILALRPPPSLRPPAPRR